MTVPFDKDEFDQEVEELHENAIEDYIADSYTEEAYDEMLDECHKEYKIGGLTFSASQVLRDCDPVAYRCGFGNEEDNIRDIAESMYSLDDFRDQALENLDMEEEQ